MILASSPPSSMATSVWGATRSKLAATATTSWTKPMPRALPKFMEPEPVIPTRSSQGPSCARASRRSSASVSWVWARWRRYCPKQICPFASKITSFTVVEPMSIPAGKQLLMVKTSILLFFYNKVYHVLFQLQEVCFGKNLKFPQSCRGTPWLNCPLKPVSRLRCILEGR